MHLNDGKYKPEILDVNAPAIPFRLRTNYTPTGDQPQAIDTICQNIRAGVPSQVLLGVTGSG
ncbi:MAG: hypothetical protein OSJ28_08960, partial [Desulfovibrio sp.]|nr:hypothetical protein [Desulfovibrio sp.]